MMIHVGVDLHQRFCYMTALETRGKLLQSGAVNNERLALKRYFRQFRGQAVGAAVAGDRWVRQAGTAMAGAGEAAGEGTADASGVLAHDRLLYAGDRRAKPSTKCRGSERCAGAVADDDSGNRGLFGHAAAGRDWKHRALCRQSGVVQLRWTGAASAGVGGQGGARRNHAAGLTLLALDHGGSSPGGNALFAGGQGLLRTTAQEEARACGASGAGTKVIERGPCPVARWRGV